MKINSWLIVVLVLSIGINLLVAGIVIGRMLQGPSPMLTWMTEGVSEKTRSRIANSLREHFIETSEIRRQMRDLRAQLSQSVVADEYDEEMVTVMLGELRTLSARLQNESHRQITENLRELTPEERRQSFRLLMDLEMRNSRVTRMLQEKR